MPGGVLEKVEDGGMVEVCCVSILLYPQMLKGRICAVCQDLHACSEGDTCRAGIGQPRRQENAAAPWQRAAVASWYLRRAVPDACSHA
jgi:hypothetical protein